MSERTPINIKTATEVRNDLYEHIVSGIVTIVDELHRNDSNNLVYDEDSPPLTYQIQSGLPDISNGILKNITRIWGIKNESFYEFVLEADYTFDVIENTITFVNGNEPDDTTEFYVSYKYDQQYKSGITNIARGTVADSLISAFSFTIGETFRAILLAKLAASIDDAVGTDLEQLVALIGMEKKNASVANGFVTVFRGTTSGKVEIPIGTQFSTDATDVVNSVIFETSETGYFLDGFSSVRLPIIASIGYEGTIGNMAPNFIKNVISSVAGIIRVNNPFNYVDYDFDDLVLGKYTYTLSHLPERVINTSLSFPVPVTDKGLYYVMYWSDKSVNETNWGTLVVSGSGAGTVTEDEPITGVTEVDITDADQNPYLEITTLNVPRDITTQFTPGYDHVILRIRGDSGTQISVRLEDLSAVNNESTNDLYKFGTLDGAVDPISLDTDFKIFYMPHGLAGTGSSSDDNIAKFRITFSVVGKYYIDFVGLGTILKEVQVVPQNVDEINTSYSSGNMGVYKDTPDDFYSAYDGNSHDQLLVYYQWKNNISGGSNEESDEQLRDRAKIEVSGIGSGTKAALKRVLLAIEGITQVGVKDHDDDTNIVLGDVVISLLAEGFRVSPSLNTTIIEAIDKTRSAGIRVTVLVPEVRYIIFDLNIIYDPNFTQYGGADGRTALVASIKSVINDYFKEKIVVDKNLYWSDLIAYVIRILPGLFGGYINYNTNIVTATDGSTSGSILTSSSSDFSVNGLDILSNNNNNGNGDWLVVAGGETDEGTYRIISRGSDTLTVAETFNGSSGQTFTIVRAPSYADDNFTDGPYLYDTVIIFQNYVSAIKSNVSIVTQGGKVLNIKLLGA